MILKNIQYYKFCFYGFLKNLRFFDPFIILFFREIGFSFLQIGTLYSIREISTTILEIPTGLIADTYGRKKSMILSFTSYILSFLIFYFFPNFTIYIFAMILFAIGQAFRTGTHKAMILDYLKIKNISHQKIEYYGHTRGFSQFGSAISALIAGVLVFYSGSYKIVFLGSVFPYILGLILLISYPNELDGKIEKIKEKKTIKTIFNNFKNTILSFFQMSKNPLLIKALFNSSLYDGLFKTIKDYLQPILQTFALSIPILLSIGEKRSTIFISLTYFFIYLLTSYSSRKASRFSKKFSSLAFAINFSFILGIILTIASGLFYAVDLKILTIVIFIILYAAQNIRRPLNIGYISENISSKIMATGLSVESQLKTLTIAILSPIMGFFADTFGIGLALIILSFLIIVLYPVIKVVRYSGVEK
ncbi:MAG: MFS transporter [Candidatus Cloacimonetes bacterium]|nr:MFS transporter [Candidatus Cloacimonadota bacterium]